MQVRPGRSYFNPRLREGGDPKRYLSHIFFPISIHASAREATGKAKEPDTEYEFQSAPPRGRRLYEICEHIISGYFNPRLREGGDRGQRDFSAGYLISIRASAREATLCSHLMMWKQKFQSAPPRGRRLVEWQRSHRILNFNPRLREGGDFVPIDDKRLVNRFQSAPPRGRRRCSANRFHG